MAEREEIIELEELGGQAIANITGKRKKTENETKLDEEMLDDVKSDIKDALNKLRNYLKELENSQAIKKLDSVWNYTKERLQKAKPTSQDYEKIQAKLTNFKMYLEQNEKIQKASQWAKSYKARAVLLSIIAVLSTVITVKKLTETHTITPKSTTKKPKKFKTVYVKKRKAVDSDEELQD
jgi:hypothetical protein